MNRQPIGRLAQRNSAMLFFLTIVQFFALLVIAVVCRQTLFGLLLAVRCLLFPRLQYHTPLRKRLLTQPTARTTEHLPYESPLHLAVSGRPTASTVPSSSSSTQPATLQGGSSPVMVNVYATATVTRRHRVFLWILLVLSIVTFLFSIIFAIVAASDDSALALLKTQHTAVWLRQFGAWLPNHSEGGTFAVQLICLIAIGGTSLALLRMLAPAAAISAARSQQQRSVVAQQQSARMFRSAAPTSTQNQDEEELQDASLLAGQKSELFNQLAVSASTHFSVLLRRSYKEIGHTRRLCFLILFCTSQLYLVPSYLNGVLYTLQFSIGFSFCIPRRSALKWMTLSFTAQALRVMSFVSLVVSFVFTMPIVGTAIGQHGESWLASTVGWARHAPIALLDLTLTDESDPLDVLTDSEILNSEAVWLFLLQCFLQCGVMVLSARIHDGKWSPLRYQEATVIAADAMRANREATSARADQEQHQAGGTKGSSSSASMTQGPLGWIAAKWSAFRGKTVMENIFYHLPLLLIPLCFGFCCIVVNAVSVVFLLVAIAGCVLSLRQFVRVLPVFFLITAVCCIVSLYALVSLDSIAATHHPFHEGIESSGSGGGSSSAASMLSDPLYSAVGSADSSFSAKMRELVLETIGACLMIVMYSLFKSGASQEQYGGQRDRYFTARRALLALETELPTLLAEDFLPFCNRNNNTPPFGSAGGQSYTVNFGSFAPLLTKALLRCYSPDLLQSSSFAMFSPTANFSLQPEATAFLLDLWDLSTSIAQSPSAGADAQLERSSRDGILHLGLVRRYFHDLRSLAEAERQRTSIFLGPSSTRQRDRSALRQSQQTDRRSRASSTAAGGSQNGSGGLHQAVHEGEGDLAYDDSQVFDSLPRLQTAPTEHPVYDDDYEAFDAHQKRRTLLLLSGGEGSQKCIEFVDYVVIVHKLRGTLPVRPQLPPEGSTTTETSVWLSLVYYTNLASTIFVAFLLRAASSFCLGAMFLAATITGFLDLDNWVYIPMFLFFQCGGKRTKKYWPVVIGYSSLHVLALYIFELNYYRRPLSCDPAASSLCRYHGGSQFAQFVGFRIKPPFQACALFFLILVLSVIEKRLFSRRSQTISSRILLFQWHYLSRRPAVRYLMFRLLLGISALLFIVIGLFLPRSIITGGFLTLFSVICLIFFKWYGRLSAWQTFGMLGVLILYCGLSMLLVSLQFLSNSSDWIRNTVSRDVLCTSFPGIGTNNNTQTALDHCITQIGLWSGPAIPVWLTLLPWYVACTLSVYAFRLQGKSLSVEGEEEKQGVGSEGGDDDNDSQTRWFMTGAADAIRVCFQFVHQLLVIDEALLHLVCHHVTYLLRIAEVGAALSGTTLVHFTILLLYLIEASTFLVLVFSVIGMFTFYVYPLSLLPSLAPSPLPEDVATYLGFSKVLDSGSSVATASPFVVLFLASLLHLRLVVFKRTDSTFAPQQQQQASGALPRVESTRVDPNTSSARDSNNNTPVLRRSVADHFLYLWRYVTRFYVVDFGYEIVLIVLLLTIYISMDQLVGVYTFLLLVAMVLVGRWRLTVREGSLAPQVFIVLSVIPILILYLFRMGLPPSFITGCPFQPSLCQATHSDYALYIGLTSSSETVESIAFLCAVIFWLRIVRDQVPKVRARSPLYMGQYYALGDWLQSHDVEIYQKSNLYRDNQELQINHPGDDVEDDDDDAGLGNGDLIPLFLYPSVMEATDLSAHRVVSGLNYSVRSSNGRQTLSPTTTTTASDAAAQPPPTPTLQPLVFYSPVLEPQTVPDFIVMLLYRAFPASVICFFHGALFPSFLGIIEILIGILLVAYKQRIISRFYVYWRWVIAFFLLRLLVEIALHVPSVKTAIANDVSLASSFVVIPSDISESGSYQKIQSDRQVSSIVLLMNVLFVLLQDRLNNEFFFSHQVRALLNQSRQAARKHQEMIAREITALKLRKAAARADELAIHNVLHALRLQRQPNNNNTMLMMMNASSTFDAANQSSSSPQNHSQLEAPLLPRRQTSRQHDNNNDRSEEDEEYHSLVDEEEQQQSRNTSIVSLDAADLEAYRGRHTTLHSFDFCVRQPAPPDSNGQGGGGGAGNNDDDTTTNHAATEQKSTTIRRPTKRDNWSVHWNNFRSWAIDALIANSLSHHESLAEVQTEQKQSTSAALLWLCYRVALRKSQYVCFLFIFVNFALNGTILHAIPCLSVFLYGCLAKPWAHAKYWDYLLVYISASIVIQSALQILVEHNVVQISSSQSALAVLFVGRDVHSNGSSAAVFVALDFTVFALIVLQRQLCHDYGLFVDRASALLWAKQRSKKKKQRITSRSNRQKQRAPSREAQESEPSDSLSAHRSGGGGGGVSFAMRNPQDDVEDGPPQQRHERTPHFIEVDEDGFVEIVLQSQQVLVEVEDHPQHHVEVDENGRERNHATYFQYFRKALVQRRGAGKDFYTIFVASEVLAMILVTAMYYELNGNQHGNIIDSIQEDLLPGKLVLFLFLLVLLMCFERILYITDSIRIKIGLHVLLVVFYHVSFLVWVALFPFGNVASAASLLAVKSFSLFVSCIQIRDGYPLHRRHDPFTSSTSWFHWVGFTLYRVVPFLFEMRVILDWSFTRTSLKLPAWQFLEDLHSEVYLRFVDRADDFSTNPGRGMRYPISSKLSQGVLWFCTFLLILFFPLWYYSDYNPNIMDNSVTALQVSIGFDSFATLYTSTGTNVQPPTTYETMLGRTRPRLQSSGFFETAPTLQVLKVVGCSSDAWEIPPVSKRNLIALVENALNKSSPSFEPLTLSLKSSFSRSGASTSSSLTTMLESRYELPDESLVTLYDALISHDSPNPNNNASLFGIELPNFFTPFFMNKPTGVQSLDTFASAGVSSVNSLNCTLSLNNVFDDDASIPVMYWCMTCGTLFTSGNFPTDNVTAFPENECFANPSTCASLYNFEQNPPRAGPNGFPKATTGNSLLNEQLSSGASIHSYQRYEKSKSMFFIVESDQVVSSSRWLSGFGIVALYTTFILAIGTFIRGLSSGSTHRVIVSQMNDPTPVAELLRLIYMARHMAARRRKRRTWVQQQQQQHGWSSSSSGSDGDDDGESNVVPQREQSDKRLDLENYMSSPRAVLGQSLIAASSLTAQESHETESSQQQQQQPTAITTGFDNNNGSNGKNGSTMNPTEADGDADADLYMEEQLYAELVDLLRSPERLLNMTGRHAAA